MCACVRAFVLNNKTGYTAMHPKLQSIFFNHFRIVGRLEPPTLERKKFTIESTSVLFEIATIKIHQQLQQLI